MCGPTSEALLAGWWPCCLVINEYLRGMPGSCVMGSTEIWTERSRQLQATFHEEGVGWEVLLGGDIMFVQKKLEAETEVCIKT